MRWTLGRGSDNLEDRRSFIPKAAGGIGGLFLIGIFVALLGGDPTPFFVQGLQQGVQMQVQSNQPTLTDQEQDKMIEFVKAILGTTEDTWAEQFQQIGRTYQLPHMVVFNGVAESACGNASSSVGPFYCPMDQKVYFDLEFFQELKTRHNSPGDFAGAYVIAHEIGHHVQNQLGILNHRGNNPSRMNENQNSVKVELMADCFAGVWAHDNEKLLESGDIEEALHAASQIGDDTLQKKAQGYVVPDSFTHGSAKQRSEWFYKGYKGGTIESCDTSRLE